jgi:hypothetical protein
MFSLQFKHLCRQFCTLGFEPEALSFLNLSS